MEWIQTNWLWILFGGAFVAMHMFGHRRHRHGANSRSAHAPHYDILPDEPAVAPADEPGGTRERPVISSSQAVPVVGPNYTGHDSPANPKDGKPHRHGC